jgi:hypothetical protein
LQTFELELESFTHLEALRDAIDEVLKYYFDADDTYDLFTLLVSSHGWHRHDLPPGDTYDGCHAIRKLFFASSAKYFRVELVHGFSRDIIRARYAGGVDREA